MLDETGSEDWKEMAELNARIADEAGRERDNWRRDFNAKAVAYSVVYRKRSALRLALQTIRSFDLDPRVAKLIDDAMSADEAEPVTIPTVGGVWEWVPGVGVDPQAIPTTGKGEWRWVARTGKA